MAQYFWKVLYDNKEAPELCLRRDSDKSGDDSSDEDSEMPFDSEEEDMWVSYYKI